MSSYIEGSVLGWRLLTQGAGGLLLGEERRHTSRTHWRGCIWAGFRRIVGSRAGVRFFLPWGLCKLYPGSGVRYNWGWKNSFGPDHQGPLNAVPGHLDFILCARLPQDVYIPLSNTMHDVRWFSDGLFLSISSSFQQMFSEHLLSARHCSSHRWQ